MADLDGFRMSRRVTDSGNQTVEPHEGGRSSVTAVLASKTSAARGRRPGGLIRAYCRQLSWLARIADTLCIWLTLHAAVLLRGQDWNRGYTLIAVIAIILYALFAQHAGLYRSWRANPLRDEVGAVVLAWGAVVLSLLVLAWFTKTGNLFSRLVVGGWFIAVFVSVAGWRLGARALLRRSRELGLNTRTVAIAGGGETALHVARNIERCSWMGLRLVGIFDDRGESCPAEASDDAASPLGDFDQMEMMVRRGEIEIVYVALPLDAARRVRELIERFSDTTASLYLVPDMRIVDLLQGRWMNVGDLPVVSVFETPFHDMDSVVKRGEDLLLLTFILPVIALPMLVIAALVRLTSPGPAIFSQRRYGLDGRSFRMFKFRTMTVQEDGEGIAQAAADDPRVTPLGGFLRRHSLDELPQFINVLRGEMSVIGPRPHAVAHNEQYRKSIGGYMLRHKVQPGISGWAQVNGWRGETNTEEKMRKRVEHDLWYIRNWSLLLDLRILVLSLWRGFRSEGVH